MSQYQTEAPGRYPDETLIERLAQPAALEGWLAQVDQSLARRPDDSALAARRAELLRALGRLDESVAAYEALGTSAGGDMASLLRGKAGGQAPPVDATRFVRLTGVLSDQERQRLWDSVGADDAKFGETWIGQADKVRLDPFKRRSATMADDSAIRKWFLPRINDLIGDERILERLGLAPFAVGMRELQVTRHLDGGFYRVHRDAGLAGDVSATRTLTYVYYFHRTPRRFTGGDLLLFDHGEDGKRSSGLGFTRLAPDDDTLVFFASDRLHTVTPVSLSSNDPMDGRWTVNGWLHTCV